MSCTQQRSFPQLQGNAWFESSRQFANLTQSAKIIATGGTPVSFQETIAHHSMMKARTQMHDVRLSGSLHREGEIEIDSGETVRKNPALLTALFYSGSLQISARSPFRVHDEIRAAQIPVGVDSPSL